MKKLFILLVIVMVLLAGCSKEESEGITLSREVYDALMASKVENDQLKTEIDYLKTRIDENTLEQNEGEDSETEAPSETTEVEAVEEKEEVPQYSYEDIKLLTLEPYIGEYNLYGYKDQDGNVIIEPEFDMATSFDNNQALIQMGGKTGQIDYGGRITWTETDTYKRIQLEPTNDIKAESEFALFLKDFKAAIENEDEEYIRSHTYSDIKMSSTGLVGIEGLVKYWGLEEEDTAFYLMLNNTLKYGLVDISDDESIYLGPYTFANFPEGYDASKFYVCIGTDVNVRKRPTTKSDVISQLTYDVVEVIEVEAEEGWHKIKLPNGDRGYISASYLRSPLDYRINFSKYNGEWLMDIFIKGK